MGENAQSLLDEINNIVSKVFENETEIE